MPRKISRKGLNKKLDKAWSDAIKRRANQRCEVCGKTDTLNSHHIVGRRNLATRWDIQNGVCLCAGCHTFKTQSAHQDPVWFTKWLEDKRSKDLKHLEEIKNTITKRSMKELQELLHTLDIS